ncbi:MAG: HesB/IscA family protein [Prochlorotrichaceae cyanobacterium]|jgi:iron-sulfur cluster assembly accessory protein
MPETSPDLPLQFSPAAIAEIRRFCRQRGYTTAQIRLNIAPGGCQGYHYTLDFAPGVIQTSDWSYSGTPSANDLQIAIAPEAVSALQGATLDYAEDLMGGSFRFQNPPVQGLCACGLSFVPSSPAGPPPTFTTTTSHHSTEVES